MFESLFEALQMSFMQRALAATLAMSLLCPVMGLFLVLRRSSMTGDALSHSSLAGAAAALALGVNPVVGTFVFTAVCGLMIEALRSVFRHYGDLVLTIVQALSVGIALTLITMGLVKGNAESFLFGSILTISQTDLWCILAITAAALLWVGFGLSTLTVIAFDEDSARAAGQTPALVLRLFSAPRLCRRRRHSDGGRTRAELHDRAPCCHGTPAQSGLQTNADRSHRHQHH